MERLNDTNRKKSFSKKGWKRKMASAKYEKDMPIIQQHWNHFITLVRQDLKDTYKEQRNVVIEIRRLERISKIVQHSQGDIDFLLLHKESILSLDRSLAQKFSILEAFKNLNNLGNAVAIRTCKEILENETVKQAADLMNGLIERRESLQTLIDTTNDLIYGASYNKKLIDQLCEKHKVEGVARNAIALYPIIKTLKKEKTIKMQEQPQVTEEVSLHQSHHEEQQDVETLDTALIVDEESPTNRQAFDAHKEQYDQIKEQMNTLLNKYYVLLSEMTPTETQYYRIYCLLTDEQLKDTDLSQVKEEYEEAAAKIAAIRLFDAKTEIEKMMKELSATDFSDKDDIEYFGAYVEEYKLLSTKLKELDGKIAKTEEEGKTQENQKVFFLTDKAMNPILPKTIQERGLQGSLITILEKAQAGFIQQKKRSNIMPLKIHDKKFKDACGRTVFAVRNSKVIVSYIKLNSNTGISNDGGIMILTASVLNPNTIQDDTDRVIKEHRDQIISQMDAIEKGDSQQLGLQSMIRENIVKQGQSNTEEGVINGRKTK